MGSGWLLGTNYLSVQFFPPLPPFANNLLQRRDFLSSHLVSLHPSKGTSLPMISFCLFTSPQRAADPTGKCHNLLRESSPVPPRTAAVQPT